MANLAGIKNGISLILPKYMLLTKTNLPPLGNAIPLWQASQRTQKVKKALVQVNIPNKQQICKKHCKHEAFCVYVSGSLVLIIRHLDDQAT